MSAIDLVRKYFAGVTDEEAEILLWNATAFPICSYDRLCTQLEDLAAKANGFSDAMRIAMAEFDCEWKAYRAASKEGAA